MLVYVLFAAGFILLIKGADYLVTGASSLAKRWNIPDLVIGLTVVSFGTSMPELVVSLISSLKGNTEIALGNILGSNIANILLILGVSAMITPLAVRRSTVLSEIPYSIIAALLLGFLANASIYGTDTRLEITRSDGFVLLFFFIIYLGYMFYLSRQESQQDLPEGYRIISPVISWAMIAGGTLMLFFGGKWVIDGAVTLARNLQLSEGLIGLTLVAVGTSLPELVTSVVAASRKNADIAVGNVIGSNIFNIFWILGLCSVIHPLPFQSINNIDILVVIFSSILIVIVMIPTRRNTISRPAGFLFLLLYLVYLYWVIQRG